MMPTYDSLSDTHREIVVAMSYAARTALRNHFIQPRNDDAAARFDEACAVFFVASVLTSTMDRK